MSGQLLSNVRVRRGNGTDVEQFLAAESNPGDSIVPKWDLMYFVEAVDQQGQGWKVLDWEKEIPYVIVTVER